MTSIEALTELKRLRANCGVMVYLPRDVAARMLDIDALRYRDMQFEDGGYAPSTIDEVIERAEQFVANRVASVLEHRA